VSNVAEYCRQIEIYLCRKNDGHLIRIVGPSFEIVTRWAADGVPFKVACAGIDRYFERYHRKGPRRRPVRIDFCEADVLDVFDEWRRATGVSGADPGAGPAGPAQAAPSRRGPSLPDHLERVLLRLSSLRATGVLGPDADPIVDRVSAELDAARSSGSGVRGEARHALIERLAELDRALIADTSAAAGEAMLAALRSDAVDELAMFRERMAAEAFAAAVDRATTRLLRERLGLPVITFGG
jgi:hypothetical protein